MLRKLGVLAVLTLLSAQASAQQDYEKTEALIERCGKATETDELKGCVGKLIEHLELHEEGQQTWLTLMGRCAAEKTLVAMRTCILTMTSPPIPSDQARPSDPPSTAAAGTPAPALVMPPVPPAPPPKPEWVVREEASRMDGSPTVFMSLLSDEPVRNSYGGSSRPMMVVRCREKTTSVFFNSDWFLGSDTQVMYRLDQDRPVTQVWNASTDNKAAGLWNGGLAIPFLKSLMGKQALLVRVTPYREVAVESSYNIAGLEKVIAPLRKACGW